MKAKNSTRALMLALIIPGLGHLYCGRLLLAMFILSLVNPFTIYYSVELSAIFTGDGPHNWLVLGVFPCAWFAQAADAWQIAGKMKRRAGVEQRRRRRG